MLVNKYNIPDLYKIKNSQVNAVVADQETTQEPLDENVWGNDYSIINKLNEKHLADRRLYVRVRNVQRIECNALSDSVEAEPVFLARPIEFTISDLSMGGIGIICDNEISIGKVLAFQLILDGIPYKIKCEVVYCIHNDNKFRAGLKIVQKDRKFLMHLKIYVARISLNSRYGNKPIQAI